MFHFHSVNSNQHNLLSYIVWCMKHLRTMCCCQQISLGTWCEQWRQQTRKRMLIKYSPICLQTIHFKVNIFRLVNIHGHTLPQWNNIAAECKLGNMLWCAFVYDDQYILVIIQEFSHTLYQIMMILWHTWRMTNLTNNWPMHCGWL